MLIDNANPGNTWDTQTIDYYDERLKQVNRPLNYSLIFDTYTYIYMPITLYVQVPIWYSNITSYNNMRRIGSNIQKQKTKSVTKN